MSSGGAREAPGRYLSRMPTPRPTRPRRSSRSLAALLVALGSLGALGARTEAGGLPLDATTRDYDQIHLVVRVTPHIEEGTIDGETTIRFASLVDSLKVLRLHATDLTVLGARDGAGTALATTQADGILSIALASPVGKGAEAEVTVLYRAKPKGGLHFHAPSKASPNTPLEVYSQGEARDNRRWMPCYDEPDDRATCEVVARVPKALQTVSNGALVESKPLDGGLREDHWKLDHRIPSYLVSLVVGRIEPVVDACGNVRLEMNGPPGRADEVKNGCSATKPVMEFFSAYTERPFPYERYAQTTVWDFVYGGMENASCTTMHMRLLHPLEVRPSYSPDGLVAHEMAHQWFGDLMTCRTFDHLWLNEGFATYFTDLFFEHRDGPDEFALARFHQNRGYMDGTKKPETLGLVPSPRGDVPLELSGGKEYSRGAAILHQLRIELGDETFRKGIARYLRENEDREVVSEDFRHSMEAEAGRDLEWFFDQWVYGAGYPVLAVRYTIEEREPKGSGAVAHVRIEQTQAGGGGQTETFRLQVPYRFGAGEAAVKGVFDVRRRLQTFDVALPAASDHRFLRVGDGGGTFARVQLQQDPAVWALALALDPDPTGRLEAIEAIADTPDAALLPLVGALSPSAKSYAVRAAAARALGALPAPAAEAALLQAVSDPDSRVREAVMEGLGMRNRAGVTDALRLAIAKDANPYVRAAAARSLGRVHADGAFETLRDLLSVDSHREILKTAAMDGLAAVGDSRAVELAHRLLPYDNPRGDHHGMRQAALRLLLALAPDAPDTKAAVVTLLDDMFVRLRIQAIEAAGNYLIRDAEPRLRAFVESEPEGGVKNAAKAALEKLTPKK